VTVGGECLSYNHFVPGFVAEKKSYFIGYSQHSRHNESGAPSKPLVVEPQLGVWGLCKPEDGIELKVAQSVDIQVKIFEPCVLRGQPVAYLLDSIALSYFGDKEVINPHQISLQKIRSEINLETPKERMKIVGF
jgi:hypothetical protein